MPLLFEINSATYVLIHPSYHLRKYTFCFCLFVCLLTTASELNLAHGLWVFSRPFLHQETVIYPKLPDAISYRFLILSEENFW